MTFLPKDPLSKSQLYLGLLSNRHEALSSNLTNMDTPNYVRRDIEFSQYLNTADSALETKLSQKLGPSGIISAREEQLSAADELALMQQNSILYAVASRQMTNTINEIKTAINVGK